MWCLADTKVRVPASLGEDFQCSRSFFLDMNYTGATALVITFVVNNHEDPEKNKMAEAWEEK